MELLFWALVILGFALYVLPAGIAVVINHRQTAPILIINLLLGWTVIGWIAALAWTFTVPQSPAAKYQR